MSKVLQSRWMVGMTLALLSPLACAMSQEERQLLVSHIAISAFVLIGVVMAIFVFFQGTRDRREEPMSKLMMAGQTIHAVANDARVIDCVRTMHDKRIGALLVMDGDTLTGIFSERDAVTRVLVSGRNPHETRVFEVMTPNPYCVAPDTTVGAAMELATQKHFRHLPIVQDGRVVGVMSTRHLANALSGRDSMEPKFVSLSKLVGSTPRRPSVAA